MYPVPKQIFQKMDVCLASWGSAVNSARAGALTIRLLDDVTIIPHGIMGITITDYKSPGCSETLTELFEKIRSGEYRAEDAHTDYKPYDYSMAHKQMDQSIFNITHENAYYDISKIKKVSRRSNIEKDLNTILGIRTTKCIMTAAKKILTKPYVKMQRKESYAK